MQQGTIKAIAACTAFTIAGVAGFIFFPHTNETLLLVGYYAVLVLNTFFSIKAFAAITPKNTPQALFDAVLVLIYIALALSFSSVIQFSVVSWGLFVLANVKYMHLEGLIPQKKFLQHKMRLNWLGAFLSGVAFAIALLGLALPAAWTLFVIFSIAQFYLLVINPMYRMR